MIRMKTARIGVGIVGAGGANIATSCQIPACLQSEKVKLVALCDNDPEVKHYATRYGVDAYLNYQDMLRNPHVQMVQIATPDWCHLQQAMMALKQGKHVLLQKPPCISLQELEQLRGSIKNSSGSLKVLLNNRYTRTCRSIGKYLSDDVIGALKEIHIIFRGHRFPIMKTTSPYLTKKLGGVWLHNGMHWLDEAFYYADALPVSVQVFAAENRNGPPELLGEGPNYWSAFFRLANGITFKFEYNTMLLKPGLPSGLERRLIGQKGEIRHREDSFTLYSNASDDAVTEKIQVSDADLSAEADVLQSFRLAIDCYAAQIQTGKENPPRAHDSLALIVSLLQGIESWENRECISNGRDIFS